MPKPKRKQPPASPAPRYLILFPQLAPAALLGEKGARLHEMAAAGLLTPPGFTLTPAACAAFHAAGGTFPPALAAQLRAAFRTLKLGARSVGASADSIMGVSPMGRRKRRHSATFDRHAANAGVPAHGRDAHDTVGHRPDVPPSKPANPFPLLLAVRGGAEVSLGGLLPTLLNVGLTDKTADQLARAAGEDADTDGQAFAHDLYARLIPDYAQAVAGIDRDRFGPPSPDLAETLRHYQAVYAERAGHPWPQDAFVQLEQAIAAAFRGWNAPLAVAQRRKRGLQHLPGLAVTVQAMVYGTLGPDSAAGHAFSRDPETGADRLVGEFLPRAQGSDFARHERSPVPLERLRFTMPAAARELLRAKRLVERTFRDAQEFQFVLQRGTLYFLHTRPANRAPAAAVRIAVDLARRNVIDRRAALARVEAQKLETLLHPTFDPAADRRVIDRGLPASPGAASGKLAFTAAEAEARAKAGEIVLLVRPETHPEDLAGMSAAAGILTSTGGMTSHAAVVARGSGKVCVSGAAHLRIDEAARRVTIHGKTYGPDDYLSIDGSTGDVIEGQLPTAAPRVAGPLATLLRWADGRRTLEVRANADTPADARIARDFGAQGIGLCRTEHMFFIPERLRVMRRMILAPDVERRQAALADLLLYQRGDFLALFRTMRGLPVTIRLLDPPLHEFLPRGPAEQQAMADDLGLSLARVKDRVAELHEFNPMLGHRGVRLVVTYPEILRAQARAILLAAADAREQKARTLPEIMVPLTGTAGELAWCKTIIDEMAAGVSRERGVKLDYRFGTMIETPRAALAAGELAKTADFFSFGTNDLTQLTFGYSRDDAHRFLGDYLRHRLLPADPFQTLDTIGVGELIRLAVERGRATRPNLKCGLCGEHGGDPASIAFCEEAGLDYVSCSPYRVPIARLAAAQTKEWKKNGDHEGTKSRRQTRRREEK